MSSELTTFREQKNRRATLNPPTDSTSASRSMTKTPGENYYETLGEPQIRFADGGGKSGRRREVTYANLPDVVTSKRDDGDGVSDGSHRRRVVVADVDSSNKRAAARGGEDIDDDDDIEDPMYENVMKPEAAGLERDDDDDDDDGSCVTYMNVPKPRRTLSPSSTYDVPKSSRPIYDSPRRNNTKVTSTAGFSGAGRNTRGTPSPDYMCPDGEDEEFREDAVDDDDDGEGIDDDDDYAMYDTPSNGRRYEGHQQQDNWRYTPEYCESMSQGLEVILEEPELECCQSSTSASSSDADSCCCDCEDGDDCSCCGDSTSSSPSRATAGGADGGGNNNAHGAKHDAGTKSAGTLSKNKASSSSLSSFSSSSSSSSSSSPEASKKREIDGAGRRRDMGLDPSTASATARKSQPSATGNNHNRNNDDGNNSEGNYATGSWPTEGNRTISSKLLGVRKSSNRDESHEAELISSSGLTVAAAAEETKKQANGSSSSPKSASPSSSFTSAPSGPSSPPGITAGSTASASTDENERTEAKKAKEKAVAALLERQQQNKGDSTPDPNKERLLEVYHETVRQRNNNKSVLASILAFNNAANNQNLQQALSKPKAPITKEIMSVATRSSGDGSEEAKQDGDKYRLPSVKDLRCRFEQDKTGSAKSSAAKVQQPQSQQQPFKQLQRSANNASPSNNSSSPALPKKPAILHPKPVAAMSPVAKKVEAAKSKAQGSGASPEKKSQHLFGDSIDRRSRSSKSDLMKLADEPVENREDKFQTGATSAGTELLTWKALSKTADADRKEKARSQIEDLRNAKIETLDHLSDSEDSGINSNQSPLPVWDPVKLAKELYEVEQPDPPGSGKTLSRLRPTFERCDSLNGDSKQNSKNSKNGPPFINMEGYLEKLPSGRRKVTFWNAWKRRYFRLENGYLRYYQTSTSEKPSQTIQLMGGSVDTIENMVHGTVDESVVQQKQMFPNVLGIDDGKGHYLVVKCASKNDMLTWQKALLTHVQENFATTYVQPSPLPMEPTSLKKVLVLDIGSRSLRAGFLSKLPTLPQVFLPTVAAVNRKTPSKKIFGFDAFCSDIRPHFQLVHPLRVTHKPSQKHHWDWDVIEGILDYAIKKTKIGDTAGYEVVVTIPWHLSSREFQLKLLDVLFKSLGFKAAYVLPQALAAFHVYNASSGIVVDIGERIDVLPITHGFVVELGASKILCGGETLASHLSMCLPGGSQVFAGQGDKLAVRYAMERLCYCAMDYASEMDCFESDSRQFRRSVPLPVKGDENVADCDSPLEIELDCGRFHGPEGLFKPELWGLDSPGIHKLVHKAIQECGVDVRREMSRNIFLSGGLTLIPGFAERLTKELDKLTPSTLTPKVHASPSRYHAAYLGAQVLSESPAFSKIAITQEEWRTMGQKIASKLSA